MSRLVFGSLALGSVAAGYFVSPWTVMNYAVGDLPAKGTREATEYTAEIESELMTLADVKKLRSDPSYRMDRAWPSNQSARSGLLDQMFTAGVLHGPGGFAVPPVVFVNDKDHSSVAFLHAGRLLTGFPLIVHGGILGTILEEAMAQTAEAQSSGLLSLFRPRAVAKKLTLNYRAPTLAHQILVVKTSASDGSNGEPKGVKGEILTLGGKVLVRGTGKFD